MTKHISTSQLHSEIRTVRFLIVSLLMLEFKTGICLINSIRCRHQNKSNNFNIAIPQPVKTTSAEVKQAEYVRDVRRGAQRYGFSNFYPAWDKDGAIIEHQSLYKMRKVETGMVYIHFKYLWGTCVSTTLGGIVDGEHYSQERNYSTNPRCRPSQWTLSDSERFVNYKHKEKKALCQINA